MYRRVLLASWLVVALLVAFALPAQADDPIGMGLDYLAAQQQADGGFTNGFSEGSDLGTTCDVVLAIAADGQDPSMWESSSGNSPLDYLYAQVAGDKVDKLGLKAKIVLALLAAKQDPTGFAGHDLIAELNAAYDGATGSYGSTIFDQAMAMLALFNAGQPVPDGAAQYLLDNQTTDGAWALFGGPTAGTGDTNTTALAVQALLATGHRDEIGEAFAYFRRVQNDDGGFPYQVPSDYGTDTDANSTAYVLQALLAADESLSNWAPGGADPLGALAALHDPQSGAFFWQAGVPSPNVMATAQATPAIAGYTFVNLPRVGAANAPAPSASLDVVLLPESGGVALLPAAVVALGAAALGAGTALRRAGK